MKPPEFPKPIYPEDKGFWSQFEETLKSVLLAKAGAANPFGTADCFENAGLTSADLCSEAVHNDWPTDLMLVVAKDVDAPFRDLGLEGGFTDKTVLLNKLMAEAAWMVSANSFCAKWEYMVPRPEEIAQLIARAELAAPDQVMAILQDHPQWATKEILTDGRTFTMYPEGCPDHPAFNAMHSAAASAAGTILKSMLDVSEIQRRKIDLGIRNVGYFRNMAGVHYPHDNNVGFWLGQETVLRFLPSRLIELGVNANLIQAALQAANTEWLAD